ncbi:tyrosine-type recombinase/integrase [Plectonema cf. radiosum LEGE 06105]|uniref:Tyrosine-type recombinase/integrase n=1 Tax=Plectonema cf. radiosum LEGE 06105 TaxID=945769 RepID=A0A8J7FDA1_9CYAN|nr:site-specific integrase [Plectonema radiosum]MBE9216439.1 tyrosine-type recombinase/integrase [Plectonema cf. radiosum LEGE 06105]
MSSKKSSNASKPGSVQIKNSNGRLQIVFSHPVTNEAGEIKTKRFYLSTKHDDTPLGRQQASIIAAKIQRDIDYGEFDATLAKYKPTASLKTVTPSSRSTTPTQDLEKLWEQYTQFKKPQISPSTYAVDYRKYRNHITSLPTKNLDDAVAIRDYLIANLTPNAAKRTLTNINACCNWAMKSKLIESNPFQEMAKDIQIPKSETTEYKINPFTPEERDAIIKAFDESKLYSYYAPLVKILFFTGCRPSEAIALQWKHINDKYITFEQAITISSKGLAVKNGLKTQSQRRFPVNNQLLEILLSIKYENNNPDDFIFKSKKGGIVDFGDFLNHAWKGYKNHRGKQIDGIVTKLVKQGVVSEYRKPYQCRHTFITLCLEADIDAKDIGKWVGNSPEVIYKHYAGSKPNLEVPEL